MSRISADMDIVHSLADHYRAKLTYVPIGGLGGHLATERVSGFIDGVPLGDIYNVNDVYLSQGESGFAGKVYYVAKAQKGDPELLLQPDVPGELARPLVHVVSETSHPDTDSERVLVGIRTRPNSRYAPVQALFASRSMHAGGNDVILREPFWRGGFYIHVEAGNRWDERVISELINTGMEFETRLYRFRVKFSPIRFEVRNLELQGRFRSVINADASAEVTENTPIHDLPNGFPRVSYPYENIVGVTPIVEVPERVYAEKVGDYQVGGGPHHDPAPNWPPTPEEE